MCNKILNIYDGSLFIEHVPTSTFWSKKICQITIFYIIFFFKCLRSKEDVSNYQWIYIFIFFKFAKQFTKKKCTSDHESKYMYIIPVYINNI